MKFQPIQCLLRSAFHAVCILSGLCFSLLVAPASHAASLSWDGTLSGGPNGGSGTWNANATLNWWNGSIRLVWPNSGTDNDALFGGVAGTVTLSTVTANDLTFTTNGYTLADGTLILNGSAPTIATNVGVSVTISSILAGSSGLTKTGAGTLVLTGTNSYTGTTTISPGGMLSISSDANLGAVPETASASSIVIDNGIFSTNALAPFILNARRGIAVGTSSGGGSGTFNVTSSELVYDGIITNNGLSGTGSLVKTGSGILTLSGANTYSGNTLISEGTLKIASSSAIPSLLGKGDVVTDSTMDLNGNSITVNGLSGSSAGRIITSVAGAVTLTAGGNNKGGTYNGLIQNGSGTLALTKIGTGTLILGGANTFTGGVTINGGILQLANAGALNSAVSNSLSFGPSAAVGTKLQLNGNSITLSSLSTHATPGTVILENGSASAATLTINQAGNTSFAGTLQNQAGGGGGALSLIKTGVGTLTLSGTNTYTGSTTISGGTLALSGGTAVADSGAVVLSNTAGATLMLNASETIGSLAGGGATGGYVNLQSYVLTVGGANSDTSYVGVLSGTGSLVKTGTGTLTLVASNTYSGNTTVSSGTLKFGANNVFSYGAGQGDITVNGTLDLNGRTVNNGRINGLKGSGTVTNSSASAAYLTVGYGDASSTFSGALVNGLGTLALAKTGAGTLTLSGSSTYTGTTTITQGTLSVSNLTAGGNLGSGTSAVVLGDSSNAGLFSYTGTSAAFTRGFTVNAGSGAMDVTIAGQTLTLSTGNVATSGAFTVGGAGNTAITSNVTGTGSLNKNGAGTLTLSGSNTYTGVTNIKNGMIVLAVNDTGLKSTTTLTLGDASANTNGVLKLDSYTQTLAGLAVAGNGTGNRVIGGNAVLSLLTLNPAGVVTFAGILGGTGTNDNNLALIKSGAGTLTLSGTNTFTGGSTVTAGTLSISRDNNLGGTNGGVVLDGGALSANGSFTLGSSRSVLLGSGSGTLDVTTGNTLTYAGVLANNGVSIGSLIKTSPGTLILSGNNSYGGTTTIKDGTLTLGISNALPTGTSLTLGGSTTGGILKLNGKNQELAGMAAFGGGTNRVVNGNLTASTLTLNITGASVYSAYLGGTGTNENNFSVIKSGLGSLTLAGANTYAGNTTVSAGTLKIGSSVTLPSGAGKGNLVLNGILDLSTYGVTINGLSGAGTVTTTSSAGTRTLSVGSNDQSSTFDGIIQNGDGMLALTKTGTGTLTLTGANSYGGVTTILTGGILKVGRMDAIPFGIDKSSVAVTGTLDLNANSITLNGLTSNGTVLSNAAGAVTLTLGAADTSASFTGVIKDGSSGTIAFTKIGAGVITLGGASTYSGNTSVTDGTLRLNGNSAIPSGTGKGNVSVATGSFLDLNARNNTINGLTGLGTLTNSGASAATLTVGSNNQTSTFNGLIQDGVSAFALAKTGTGTLILTANNTFTGGVSISGGVLQLGGDGALNSTTHNSLAFGSSVAAGTKLQLNGRSLTLGGLSTGSSVGSPVVENASATAVTLTVGNAAANTYGGVIQDGTGGGALSLVKTNSGVLTLAAFNTYTGTTTILQGTILAGGDGVFGTAPVSATAGNIVLNGTLDNPAILSINGNSNLNSNRGIALGTTGSAGLGTLDVTPTKTLTYGGILANNGGTGGLVKTGLGTLALAGASNSYSGGTTVNAGTITISTTSGTPFGANVAGNNISVTAGANLSLSNSGNIGNNQTISVASTANALGGIGFSNSALTQAQLSGMFTDSTGGYGGVLGINTAYSTALNMGTFGNGVGQGYWFLGSAVSSTYSATTLTVGAGNTYRLGGGGGTLTLSAANVLTGANNVLVGSNSTNGAGSVTLSSNSGQNYTGTTTVTGGATLSIGGDNRLGTGTGAGNIVLNAGALSATVDFTLASGRGIAVGPASGSGSGTLNVASNMLSYGGVIANNGSGTGGLIKTGTGTLVLTGTNTYTGATSINAGILNFSNIANLGAGSNITFNGGTLQYAALNTTDITARSVTFGSNGGSIDTNGNNIAFGSATLGTGSFSKTGAGMLTLNAVNAMGNITVSGGTLKLGVASATPATSNLILSGGATFDINGFDTTVTNLSANAITNTVINSAIGTNRTLTVNSNTGSTYGGVLANNAGTGGTIALNKIGSSALTLSGSNTYSGGTTLGAGSISISSDDNLGALPGTATPDIITITGGATLATTANLTLNANRGIGIGPSGTTAAILAPAAGTTLTYNGIIANNGTATGGLTKSNTTGTLVLGGINTYVGDTTISGGTLTLGNAAAIPSGSGKGNVSVSGTLDLNGRAVALNGLTGAGAVTSGVAGAAVLGIGGNDQGGTFSGVISNGSGTMSVSKSGGGTSTLSGTNTYTGGTTVTGGILSVGADSHLGGAPGVATAGNLVLNGGTLATSASFTLNSNRGIAVGPTSGSGTGTLAVGAGTTLTYGGILANNSGGTGGLTKTNTTGTLVLNGANSYAGDTTISGGTLRLGNVAAIPSGTGKGNLTLSSGSTLDLNNLSPTLNGLSGTGTVTNALAGAVLFTAGGNDANGSFGGVIQDGNGTVALTKNGAGLLTLGGLNTYSGTTTVSNGTLQLGIASALPSGTGKGNITLNGTLDLAGFSTAVNGLSGSGLISNSAAGAATLTAGASDQTSTFAGNLQNGVGSVALTKTGAGTLTLSGNNSYSGATTISAGTLAMGSSTGLSATSSVTINSSGTLDVNGNNITIDGLLGTGTLNNNGGSAATLTAGASGTTTTFSGVIADGSKAVALTKSGSGTLTLTGVNTYSGTTTIQNGTVSVANPGMGGNLGSASTAVILGDATHQGILSYTANADLTFTRGFEVNAGGGQMNITTSGKTLTLTSGGIATASGTFTLGGAGNAVFDNVISGSGGFTKANTGTVLVNSTNTYSGETTISSGTLQLGNAAALPSGSGKGGLTLNGTLDVNNLSITVNGLSGAGTLTNTASSSVTLTVGDNNGSGNFTGVLADGSGTTALTKIGTGQLRLGGVNTYSGDTTITGGTLQIGNAYAIASGPNKGNVTVGALGTLELNDYDLSLNGLSGSGLVTNHLGASVLAVGSNNQSTSFTGNIHDGLGTIGLSKTGTGTLTLSGNNIFSGATTISGGTVSIGSDTALSSLSTLTIANAGALDLNGHVISIDGLAGTGSITNNSATRVTLTTGASGGSGIFGGTINDGAGVIALTKTGSGTVTLSNVNSYSGGTIVTGGLLAITSTGALGAIPASPTPGNIVLNGGGVSASNTFEINVNRGILVGPASGSGGGILDAAQNQTLTYNGIIANNGSGIGGLTKTGLGTLTLGGVNTYSGDTLVSVGSLQIGNALAIPSGSNKGILGLAADTTLDLNNISITVNGLSGTGGVSNTQTGTVTLSIGTNNQASAFEGLIEDGNGTTALTKVGTGTLTLSGTNEYSGGTTITAGKLSVANSAALGFESNALTIDGGAALMVTDSFNTSRSTELLGAGGGVGGAFEVASGATLEYTFSSVISGSGSLIKTGEGTLSLGGVDTYTGGTYIREGTLVSTSGQAPGPQPPAGSNLYAHHIYDGATLRIAVGSWSTERQIELIGDSVGIGGMAKIDITNGYVQQRNGLIYGAGKLDLLGTGTMIITNANTYSGGTIVENGVLQVNNGSGSATGSGAVTVQNAGTLSGLPDAHGSSANLTGSISGAVEIKGTGELLSRSGGTLTLGGLTLDAGAFSTFQLGVLTATPVVRITGSNAFTLAGASTIDIINTGLMAVGTYHLFDYAGTAFSSISNLALADPHSGLYNLSLTNNTGETSIDLDVTAIAQQWKKGGANTHWSSAANWWTGVVPNAVGAEALFLNNNYLKDGDPVFESAETVTLDSSVTVGSIAFNNDSTAFTIHATNGSTLTLDEVGSAGSIQILSAPNSAHANNVIDAPVILAHDLDIGIAAGDYGLDISGPISGAGMNLTKSGAGPLTLSGAAANTYGGLTDVIGGTLHLNKTAGVNAFGGDLQIGNGSTVALLASHQIADAASVTVNGTFALGTYSETIASLVGGGAVTTGSGSVLTLQSAANSDFDGVISGAGRLAKAGLGTLTLNGINTYTGGTAINSGILRVGADHHLGGTGGLTFDGGTLAFSNGFSSARSILLNSGGGTLDTDNSDVILTGLISGTGALTKIGIGTVTLNTANDYTGATVIENGILRVSHTLSLGTVAGGTTVMSGGELELYGDGLTVNEPLTLDGGEVCSLLGINTYNGAITLTADSGIDADSDQLIITGAIGQSGGAFGLTKFGPGVVELTGTNTYTGATHVETGTLLLSNGAAIADTEAVILANTPGALLQLNASETIGSLAGGGTSGGYVNLGNHALTVAGVSNTIFAGSITGVGGSLMKDGSGTLTLTGANAYSGLTTVTAGVLSIQNATALGTTDGFTTVGDGAALQLQGDIAVGAEALTLNGTGISTTGALRNISGNNVYGGLLTLGSAARIQSDTGSLTLSNTGTITGSDALTVGGAGDTSISSILGMGGSLTKDGGGTLTLSGANTYTGDTLVSEGTLQVDHAQAIPSGAGKGNVSLAAGATLDLNNTLITVNGLDGSGLVTHTQTGAAGLTVGANHQTSTFDGTIIDGNGTTSLTKVGTGILTLTGSNNYSGGTTLTEGTLRVSADSNLGHALDTPTAGSLVLDAGATLSVTGTFTLDSSRGLAIGPASGSGAGIVDVASTHTLTYGGIVADRGGSGGLTKSGDGTLVLSGTNSYTGITTVSGGTLIVNGVHAGSAAVNVSVNATLAGTGILPGAATVSGVLSPGVTLGALKTGALVFESGSSFSYEMNSFENSAYLAADLQIVNGNLSLARQSGQVVHLLLTDLAGTPAAFAANSTTLSLIQYAGTWNGGFFTYGMNELENGETFEDDYHNTWTIQYNAETGGSNFATPMEGSHFITLSNLTAVPEPGSLMALGCLIGSGVFLRSRRAREFRGSRFPLSSTIVARGQG